MYCVNCTVGELLRPEQIIEVIKAQALKNDLYVCVVLDHEDQWKDLGQLGAQLIHLGLVPRHFGGDTTYVFERRTTLTG